MLVGVFVLGACAGRAEVPIPTLPPARSVSCTGAHLDSRAGRNGCSIVDHDGSHHRSG